MLGIRDVFVRDAQGLRFYPYGNETILANPGTLLGQNSHLSREDIKIHGQAAFIGYKSAIFCDRKNRIKITHPVVCYTFVVFTKGY